MAKSQYHGRMRLSVDIPEDVYRQLKMITIERNCTITKWIVRAILEEIKKELQTK